MLDQIKSLLGFGGSELPERAVLDKNLAAATLMVQVIVADGKVTPEEEERLGAVLSEHYTVSGEDARALAAEARARQSEAIDLYSFTSVLKRDMPREQRLALIEDLWEMVYADGELHEFEDNVVWRVAELVGIDSQERITLKQRVLDRITAAK